MVFIKEQETQTAIEKITKMTDVTFGIYVPGIEDVDYYWNDNNMDNLIDKGSNKIKDDLLNQCGRFKCITISGANFATCDSFSNETYERLLTGLYIGISKFCNDVGDDIINVDFLINYCKLDRNEINYLSYMLLAFSVINKEEFCKIRMEAGLLWC